jgi:ATP-dependent Clp protease ATP-binding subunit ClpC
MKERVTEAMKKTFRPEFLNRVDEIVVFHALSREQLRAIADLMLRRLSRQLIEHRITLEVTDAAKNKLVDEGFSREYGARPLRRAIQRLIEDRMSEELLKGGIRDGDAVVIDVENNEFRISAKEGKRAGERGDTAPAGAATQE